MLYFKDSYLFLTILSDSRFPNLAMLDVMHREMTILGISGLQINNNNNNFINRFVFIIIIIFFLFVRC